MRRFCFVLSAFFLLAGCAGVDVKKVTSGKEEGIRFYRPHPYLLVTLTPPPTTGAESGPSTADKPKPKQATPPADPTPATPDSTGKVYMQIVWLPDKSENYAIEIRSGLGTIDSSFQLKDGWQLTQFGGKIDTKIPETIAAVSSLLQAAAGVPAKVMMGERRLAPAETIKPGLYRLEFDKSGMVTRIAGPIEIVP